MRIVLDTSVLIAAYISEEGVCAQALEEVFMHHQMIASKYILDEVTRKLDEKFNFSAATIAAIGESIAASSQLVVPADLPADVCRDVEDVAILGTAISGNAELLVTVDKDLLVIREYQGISICKPGEFLRVQQR